MVFYQIFYHEVQKENMYPFTIPYYNPDLTIFFENTPIAKLVTETDADKIAVCSWKLSDPDHTKTRWNLGWPRRISDITEEILNSDYDVLPFTRNSYQHEMIGAASLWHPGFRETITKIVEGIGKRMPSEVKIPIYQNAFSAKREIYQDYVNDYLNPAMELVKNSYQIRELSLVDSHYNKLMREDCLKPEELMLKFGLPHYPLIPFILERLFSVYVHNKRVNVTFL